jgi:hypothetical protein
MGKIPYKGNVKIRFIFLIRFCIFTPKCFNHKGHKCMWLGNLDIHLYGEGPRSRCYGHTAAFRLIEQWIYSYSSTKEKFINTSHNRKPKNPSPKLFVDLPHSCPPPQSLPYTGLHCSLSHRTLSSTATRFSQWH